jgi:hypothetical protein
VKKLNKKFELDLALVNNDAFIDMPKSAQLLYFHLLINADNEGLVNNVKAIQRAIRVDEDTLNVLVEENFILETDEVNEYLVVDELELRLEMRDYGNQENS